SAVEMEAACRDLFPGCHAAVFSAAVADYAPADPSNEKIKRSGNELTFRLKPNPDIAANIGAMKSGSQVTLGFALETSNGEVNAIKKLEEKNFDLIVLNSANKEGEGFLSDTNRITILDRKHQAKSYPLKDKKQVAVDIVSALEKLMVS
ncbi:MAG: phosphopantothenoylcysteine decarboxylase, partial [Marinilabiliaceae bacterium]